MSKCYTEQMIHAERSATYLSLQYTQDRKIQRMWKERIPNWTPNTCPVKTNRIPTSALAYITLVQRHWVPRKCLRVQPSTHDRFRKRQITVKFLNSLLQINKHVTQICEIYVIGGNLHIYKYYMKSQVFA
jgi:hypothetical protein